MSDSSWTRPPDGARPAAPVNLHRMERRARTDAVEALADDLVDRFAEDLLAAVDAAEGRGSDQQMALAMALRALARQLLGVMMSEALASTGDAGKGNEQVTNLRQILTLLSEELGQITVAEVPIDGDLPAGLAVQLAARIAACQQEITDAKILRICDAYHVVLKVKRA